MSTRQAIVIAVLMFIAAFCNALLAVEVYKRFGRLQAVASAIVGGTFIVLTIVACAS